MAKHTGVGGGIHAQAHKLHKQASPPLARQEVEGCWVCSSDVPGRAMRPTRMPTSTEGQCGTRVLKTSSRRSQDRQSEEANPSLNAWNRSPPT